MALVFVFPLLIQAQPTRTVVAWGADSSGQTNVPADLSDVVAIAAGRDHTLALKADGTVVAWGDNSYGQRNVPADLSDVVAVEAGWDHAVALKGDGTVVAWGRNQSGQTDVPAGLTDVVAVAAGGDHTVALKADGSVVAWGRNVEGQTNVPADLSDVVAIAAGGYHIVALKGDGIVVAWGANWSAQTVIPEGLSDVVAVGAGGSHTVALKADGTVVAWGANWSGQTDVPAGLSGVAALAVGGSHSLAIKEDGTVAAWGSNGFSQTNVPASLSDLVTIAVSAGENHSVALAYKPISLLTQGAAAGGGDFEFEVMMPGDWSWSMSDGEGWILSDEPANQSGARTFRYTVLPNTGPSHRVATITLTAGVATRTHTVFQMGASPVRPSGTVVAWGWNGNGQTNVPADLANVVTVKGGEYHAVAVKLDGTVVAWGWNGNGQTDIPAGLSGIVAVAARGSHTVALKGDGTVAAWGNNEFGQTDVPAGLWGVVGIGAGHSHTVALKFDGTVVAWGRNNHGQANVPAGLSGVAAVAAAGDYTVALKDDGTVVAWGDNEYGQTNVAAGLSNVAYVSAGYRHIVALKGDGTVEAWGDNEYGQTNVPPGLNNVVAIAAGSDHTVALKSDGTVVAWGSSNSGQANVPSGLNNVVAVAAGDGYTAALVYNPISQTTQGAVAGGGNFGFGVFIPGGWSWSVSGGEGWFFSDEPRDQSGPQNFTYAVAPNAGRFHRVATITLSDGVRTWTHTVVQLGAPPHLPFGTVVAWGNNEAGQTTVPAGLSGVIAIAVGDSHTVALKGDGNVVAWGRNAEGQTNVPGGISDAVAVAAGWYHTVALKSDGSVVAWGGNNHGQSNVPMGLSAVVAIAAGSAHNVALKSNGTVVVWGNNNSGQANVPGGLSGVVAVAAGGSHTVALKSDGTVVAWGSNSSGQTNVPAGLSDVVAVAAGGSHTVALKDDGTVVAWGWNQFGQSHVPGGLAGVVAIAAGNNHTLALKGDGTVVAWGSNNSGQTIVPAGLTGISAIAAGGRHSVALDSILFVTPMGQSVSAAGGTFAVSVAASWGWSWTLDGGDDWVASVEPASQTSTLTFIYTVAPNPTDEIRSATITLTSDAPTDIPVTATYVITQESGVLSIDSPRQSVGISGGEFAFSVLAYGGWSWSLEEGVDWVETGESTGQSGNQAFSYTVAANHGPSPRSATITVSSGAVTRTHEIVQDGAGTVVAWGSNTFGQTNVPFGLNGVTAVAAGYSHTVALKSDGTVVAWGSNGPGQTNVPSDLNDAVAVAAGGSHTVALKSGGTVVAWGLNSSAQTNVPAGLSDVVAVAAGQAHTVALKSDGTVVAWGSNSSGQTNVPPGLNNVVAIAAGSEHTVALRSDGTVVAWGDNWYGQANVPVGLTNVVAIAGGSYHTVALMADGTVVAWGSNSSGQANVPTGLSGVVSVAAGLRHTVALKDDGTVVAWGTNWYGPTVPVGLSGVTAIAAGSEHTVVVGANLSVNLAGGSFEAAGGEFHIGVTASGGWSWKLDGGDAWVACSEPVSQSGNKTFSYIVAPNPTGENRSAMFTLTNGAITATHAITQEGLVLSVAPTSQGIAFSGGEFEFDVTSSWAWSWSVDGGAGWVSSSEPATKRGSQTFRYTVAPNLTDEDRSAVLTISSGLLTATHVITQDNGVLSVNPKSQRVAVAGGMFEFNMAALGDWTWSLDDGVDWVTTGETINQSGNQTFSYTVAGNAGPAHRTATFTLTNGFLTATHAITQSGNGTVAAWGDNAHGQTNVPETLDLGGVAAVAAGSAHTVALRSDGTVVAWGRNDYGQTNVPTDLSSVVAVAAGAEHTVALRSDGTVVAWGHNESGQTTVPTDLSSVVAVAAGTSHTVALRSDGTVVAWGRNDYGQTNVPTDLSSVVAVAAGGNYSLALQIDGTITAWGDNGYGQTNVPWGLSGVVAIAAGAYHAVALKSDGTVVAWGRDFFGLTMVPDGLSGVVAVAAGGMQTVALKGDGTLVAWGIVGIQSVPAGLSGLTAIAAGANHIVAVVGPPVLSISSASQIVVIEGGEFAFRVFALESWTWTLDGGDDWIDRTEPVDQSGNQTFSYTVAPNPGLTPRNATFTLSSGDISLTHIVTQLGDGAMVAWGSNGYGQTNVPMAGLGGVAAVAAGQSHTVALKNDGTVVAWGWNHFGQTNVPAGLSSVTAIAAGSYHSVALKGNGTVVAWGYNNSGQANVPAGLSNVIAVAAGQDHTVALKSDGTVVAWGSNSSGQANVPAGLSNVIAVAAGQDHTVALKSDGTVVAWGSNGSGQTNVPPGLTNVVAIAAGSYHTVALKSDGTVVAWGYNLYGQTNAPPGLSNVVAIAAGSLHTVALKGDGTVVAWGNNGDVLTDVPAGLSNVIAVAAGGYHTVALVSMFSVSSMFQHIPAGGGNFAFKVATAGDWSWSMEGGLGWVTTSEATHQSGFQTFSYGVSSNDDPEPRTATITLTDGNRARTHTIEQEAKLPGLVAVYGALWGDTSGLAGLSHVVAVSAGSSHTAALKSDGTVVAWGTNSYGQTSVPAGLSDVVALAAGLYHTLALKGDGTVVAWGRNNRGQTTVPAGLSNVVAIAAAGEHTVVLKGDATVVAWGDNSYGQLDVPAGLSDVVAIAAGSGHTVALKGDGSVVAWGRNYEGQTNVPAGLSNVVAIATGREHTVALKGDGTVVAWGRNFEGQTDVPAGLTGVVAIVAGSLHTVAMKADGTVVAWGNDWYGETNLPSSSINATAIAAGEGYTVVVVGGQPHSVLRVSSMEQFVSPTGGAFEFGVTAQGNWAWSLQGGEGWFTSTELIEQSGDQTFGYELAANTGPSHRIATITLSNGIHTRRHTVIQMGTRFASPSGTVVAWGSNWHGQSSVPSGLGNVVAVTAGYEHSVALRDDGTVVDWGGNQYSQIGVPSGLADVVAIAAGGFHSVALKADGTVAAWGNTSFGKTTVPIGLSGVVAVAAGGNHTVALKGNGTVVAWGQNNYGQTSVPAGLSNVSAIAAGDGHTMVLKGDGTVVAWGRNSEGQTTIPTGLSGVVGIAAGAFHNVAVKNDGTVVAWGNNWDGQTSVPVGLSEIVAVAAGGYHTVALKVDGSVVAWGDSSAGQAWIPVGLPSTISISAGLLHTVVLANGPLPVLSLNLGSRSVPTSGGEFDFNVVASGDWSWGLSEGVDWVTTSEPGNQSGDQTFSYTVAANNSPTPRSATITFTSGALVAVHTINQEGIPVLSVNPDSQNLAASGGSFNFDVTASDDWSWSLSAGVDWVTSDETPSQSGDQTFSYTVAANDSPTPRSATITLTSGSLVAVHTINQGIPVLSVDPASQNLAVAGGSFEFAVTASGEWSWSLSESVDWVTSSELASQTGDQTFSYTVSANPNPIPRSATITLISGDLTATHSIVQEEALVLSINPASQSLAAAGGAVEFAVTASSDWTWSLNEGVDWVTSSELASQTGDQTFSYSVSANTGSTPRSATFTLSSGDLTATHTINQSSADARTGSVVAWGGNHHGQTNVPAGLSDVTAIAAGHSHTVVLKADGTVVAWGWNHSGQTSVPVGLGNVTAIAAGNSHTVALKADGTVLAWGANVHGQTDVPAGLGGVTAIAAGGSHTVALKADGTVVAWGFNGGGQTDVPTDLGGVTAIAAGGGFVLALKADGMVEGWGGNFYGQTNVPAGLSGVIAIAAASTHALALKADGTVVAWGDNGGGKATVPAGLGEVIAIAAGDFHSLALKADGTLVAWGSNGDGQTDVPNGLSNGIAIAAGYGHTVALIGDTHQPVEPVIALSGDLVFGSVQVGQTVTLPLTIQNTGNAVLNVAGISFPSGFSGDWNSGSIPAGGDQIVTVTFAPEAAESYGGELSVTSDASSGTNNRALSGTGIPVPTRIISVTGDLTFGNVQVGQTFTRTLIIHNQGNSALNVTGISFPPGFSSDWSNGTIPSGGSQDVTVAFSPVAPQSYDGVVSVSSNSTHGTSSIAIAGYGISGPADTRKPTLTLGIQIGNLVSATLPLPISGMAGDNVGINRVEITLNGGPPVLATLGASSKPSAVPFFTSVQPVAGSNALVITAYDTSGNSTSLTRAFTFEQRYLLNLTHNVPVGLTDVAEKAGTLLLKAVPAKSATALSKGNLQTSQVLPSAQLTVSAMAKTGFVFSHWEGLPNGAQVSGNGVLFTMPAQDVPELKAVFVENPFTQETFAALGSKPLFQGLLRPDDLTTPGNGTVGFVNAALVPGKGSLSGKLWMDGTVTSFAAVLHGNGTVWFRAGRVLTPLLPFHGRELVMTWTADGLEMTVTRQVNEISQISEGLARPPFYSKSTPVRGTLLDVKGKQGYYTLALPAVEQTPAKPTNEYPQGAGWAGLTLMSNGTLKLAGSLAEGTKVTAAAYLAEGDEAEIFIVLPTPGGRTKEGSLLGALIFDETLADRDVTSADMRWFRPEAQTKPGLAQAYRSGWPGGIEVGAVGALYDGTVPVQTALGLAMTGPGGNAALVFRDGKLVDEVGMAFNLDGNKVVKLDAKDKTWSLKLTPKTGLMTGTFTPNWPDAAKRLPTFSGVLLQKGANPKGRGFFLGNAAGDTEPESGGVELGAP